MGLFHLTSISLVMTPQEKQFLDITSKEAETGGHIFPSMAACEAALESAYGSSELAAKALNLFGMKSPVHPQYGTFSLPTKEWENDEWITIEANWVSYPSLAACFADRMACLQRLSKVYPHYAAALAASSAEQFVTEVSQTWSTDPQRANKVLAIWHEYQSQGGSQ